jgi:hypothetical protein
MFVVLCGLIFCLDQCCWKWLPGYHVFIFHCFNHPSEV